MNARRRVPLYGLSALLGVLVLSVTIIFLITCSTPRNAISSLAEGLISPKIVAYAQGCDRVCRCGCDESTGLCEPCPDPTESEDPDPTEKPNNTPVPATSVPDTPAPAPTDAQPPKDGGGDHDEGDNGQPTPGAVVTGVVATRPAATPLPDNCYRNMAELLSALPFEEDRKIFKWANEQGLVEFPTCPYGPVYPDEAAVDIMGLPKYRELKPLPSLLGRFLDVSDPAIELFASLGFRPEQPSFLLCNHFLADRHFCPKGAITQNPLDIEEGYTWSWWSKVGPGTLPPPASQDFLSRYPEMADYSDSAPYIAAFYAESGHHEREGAKRVCPRTTWYRNCDIMLMQWYESLARLHAK